MPCSVFGYLGISTVPRRSRILRLDEVLSHIPGSVMISE